MMKKMIRVKAAALADYESRGYIDRKEGYQVKAEEHSGVFIKEYGYMILHTDYEVI